MLSRSLSRAKGAPLQCLRHGMQQCRLKHESCVTFVHKKSGEVKRPKWSPAFKALGAVDVPLDVRNGASLPAFPSLSKGSLNPNTLHSVREITPHETSPAQAYGLPRNILVDFKLLSRPCSVVRDVTLSLIQRLEGASDTPGSSSRIVLTGESGCGKSYLLLQAATHFALNDWIVLYIPRAHKLVDSSTPYAYDPKTQMYLQPLTTQEILRRFQLANGRALKMLSLAEEVSLEKRKPIPSGTSLHDVIDIGTRDQNAAPAILAIVLEELGRQTQIPVLLAVDGMQALYSKSFYRNQHFQRIKSFHLSVPRILLEYASGKRTLNRGAFVCAPTMSDTQFPFPNELRKTLNLESRPLNAYTKLIPEYLEYAEGLEVVAVPEKLSVPEAAAMFEVWGRDGALHSQLSDQLFLSKYSEASGNARKFVHGGLLASLI